MEHMSLFLISTRDFWSAIIVGFFDILPLMSLGEFHTTHVALWKHHHLRESIRQEGDPNTHN